MREILKAIFVKKWQAKLVSLFLALLLWFYVVKDQNLLITVAAPLELTNYPSELRMTNRVRTSVELALEGRRDLIQGMSKRDIKARVDLARAKEGKNIYAIQASHVEAIPKGVIIKGITPDRIEIDFEKPKPPPQDIKAAPGFLNNIMERASGEKQNVTGAAKNGEAVR